MGIVSPQVLFANAKVEREMHTSRLSSLEQGHLGTREKSKGCCAVSAAGHHWGVGAYPAQGSGGH